ncbi:MAG: YigZ family protein [Clostridia bacterium]|nr:YigZ family protein [Clostridia bacterium]
MVEKYLSISGETVTEKVIEKSRFITVSRHVDGEEEAKAFIAEISKKHAEATHNCYAYVCDKLGNNLRFSDDGEPQGTAGMPMLEVLRANGLCETAVVVTRYFGGIKLGAGGLVRAYSGCVAENIAAAQKVIYEKCAESVYAVDYPEVDAALRFFGKEDCNLLNTEYADKVAFTVAVRREREEQFNCAITNFLNGRVTIEKKREYFFPFEV